MAHNTKIRELAIKYRNEGHTLLETSKFFNISRNTLKNDHLIGENLLSFIWFISIKFVAPLAVLVIMLNAIGLKIF